MIRQLHSKTSAALCSLGHKINHKTPPKAPFQDCQGSTRDV